jgi:hypothetical protein
MYTDGRENLKYYSNTVPSLPLTSATKLQAKLRYSKPNKNKIGHLQAKKPHTKNIFLIT